VTISSSLEARASRSRWVSWAYFSYTSQKMRQVNSAAGTEDYGDITTHVGHCGYTPATHMLLLCMLHRRLELLSNGP
jgi:hypothetical protein